MDMKKIITIIVCSAILVLIIFSLPSCTGSATSTTPVTSTPKLTTINITGSANVQVLVGLSQQFIAEGVFDDGSISDISSEVTWASSDSEIATISTPGIAFVLNPGKTDITAALSGVVSKSVNLEAVGQPMLEITLIRLPNLLPGTSMQLQARMMRLNGNVDTVFPDSWSSSNTNVATISSKGLVTALAAGTTNITLSYTGFKSRLYPLTVVGFSSFMVTPSSTGDITEGSETQFTATIEYTDGKTEDVTAKAVWRSSNIQFAAFTSPGVLAAFAPGYTVIQASWEGISSQPVTLGIIN